MSFLPREALSGIIRGREKNKVEDNCLKRWSTKESVLRRFEMFYGDLLKEFSNSRKYFECDILMMVKWKVYISS
jgi:hypothetical protein